MSQDNPYTSPQTEETAKLAAARSERNIKRVSSVQRRWLFQARLALRAFYALTGIFTLLNVMIILDTQLFRDDYSPYSMSGHMRFETLAFALIRTILAGTVSICCWRLDRSLGHVIVHDGARVAVNRLIRLSRNALFALAAGFAVLVMYGMVRGVWAYFVVDFPTK